MNYPQAIIIAGGIVAAAIIIGDAPRAGNGVGDYQVVSGDASERTTWEVITGNGSVGLCTGGQNLPPICSAWSG
jgi:hypothetical protein